MSGPECEDGPFFACIDWVEDTLTTAGSSFSARSAKLSGAPRATATSGAPKGGRITTVIGRASVRHRPILAARRAVGERMRMVVMFLACVPGRGLDGCFNVLAPPAGCEDSAGNRCLG